MRERFEALATMELAPEPFVRRALALLEADFRETVLALLAAWERTGIVSAELFLPLGGLQRPSWGHWNGVLQALRKAQRAVLRGGSVDDRARLDRESEIVEVTEWLDRPANPELVSALEELATLAGGVPGGRPTLRKVLEAPIALRNRVAHDNPTEEAWWQRGESALRPIVRFHSTHRLDSKLPVAIANGSAPWLLAQGGELWSFCGLERHLVPRYISRAGEIRTDELQSGALQLAFHRLLGKEHAREQDLEALLLKATPDDQRGVLLDDLLVGRPVGEGGFAVVHVGTQLSTGRKVAVKILRDGMPEEVRERFGREANYLSRINDSHIVGILGHGEGAWRVPRTVDVSSEPWIQAFKRGAAVRSYLVIEWIDGETLDAIFHRLPATRPSDAQLLEWFAQAAEALATVHAVGLVHRDVKPGNLMINGEGSLKLMDFGVSTSRDETRTITTATGVSAGTPAYMAPEQLRARDAESEVGPKVDVYALGAAFYEMFTGTRLYSHDRETADVVRDKKLGGTRPSPPRIGSTRSRWELQTILLGTLEPEPNDRYPSMEKLARDLRRVQRLEPIEYRRTSAIRRLQLGYRRHRTVSNLSLVFFAASVMATAFYVSSVVSARRRAEGAASAARAAERDAHQSQSVAERREREARHNLGLAFLDGAAEAIRQAEWTKAAAYFAASRAEEESEAAQFGGAIARTRDAVAITLPAPIQGKFSLVASAAGDVLWTNGYFAGGCEVRPSRLLPTAIIPDHCSAPGDRTVRCLGPMAMLPDGRLVCASASGLSLWDTARWQHVGEIASTAPLSGEPTSVAYDSYRLRAAVTLGDAGLAIFELQTGKIHTSRLDGFRQNCTSVAFVFGEGIAVGCREGIWLLDAADGRTRQKRAVHADDEHIVRLRDSELVFGDGDHLRRFKGEAWEELPAIALPTQTRGILAFSEDAALAVSRGAAGALVVWRTVDGSRIASIERVGATRGAVFAKGQLVTLGEDGMVRAFRLGSVTAGVTWSPVVGAPSIVVTDDGVLRASTLGDGRGSWELRLAVDRSKYPLYQAPCIVRISADRGLVAVNDDESVRLVATSTGAVVARWEAMHVKQLAVDQTGRLVVAAAREKLWVWGREGLPSWEASLDADVVAIDVAPDGSLLATADKSGLVTVWSVAAKGVSRTFQAHDRPVGALAFSKSGALLATAGDKLVRLWDAATSTLRIEFEVGVAPTELAFTEVPLSLSWGATGMARRIVAQAGDPIAERDRLLRENGLTVVGAKLVSRQSVSKP